MPCPGLQVVTRYTSYTHTDRSVTPCPCWPASTANQSGLVTLTFDLLTLKVVSESPVTWATSVPILVFLGLSVLDLGLMYTSVRQTSDRQTSDRRIDVRQHHHRLIPSGRGHNKQLTAFITANVMSQCKTLSDTSTQYQLCPLSGHPRWAETRSD